MTKCVRTIIVDSNQSVVDSLKKYFNDNSSIKVVNTCTDGQSALEYLIKENSDIDLIIMDVLLPKLDGLSLLEKLKEFNCKSKIIIISSYNDDKIIKECSNLNVSYYIIKPLSVTALERRINDLFSTSINSSNNNKNIDLEICQLLHNLGIPSHIRGYKYIKDGIMIIYNSQNVTLITKEIYPQIAYKYETTPSRVERAIRHAVEVSWIRGDLSLMEEIFGFSVSCDKSKPTNSEFLSTIAERIKLDRDIKS